jgi:hypothetical protein
MWDAIDQLLPLDRLAVLGAAAALLGLAVLALLVFGQARELRALREWASARAVAPNGHIDAAPADNRRSRAGGRLVLVISTVMRTSVEAFQTPALSAVRASAAPNDASRKQGSRGPAKRQTKCS